MSTNQKLLFKNNGDVQKVGKQNNYYKLPNLVNKT